MRLVSPRTQCPCKLRVPVCLVSLQPQCPHKLNVPVLIPLSIPAHSVSPSHQRPCVLGVPLCLVSPCGVPVVTPARLVTPMLLVSPCSQHPCVPRDTMLFPLRSGSPYPQCPLCPQAPWAVPPQPCLCQARLWPPHCDGGWWHPPPPH